MELKATAADFEVDSLSKTFGASSILSPLAESIGAQGWVEDTERILHDITLDYTRQRAAEGVTDDPVSFELAGPRKHIYWNPSTTRVAIVTCGGLAPGLNNVVQSIVTVLGERYGVKNIFGVPFGYFGFTHDPETKRFRFGWTRLSADSVQTIDFEGGSILGSSRGHSNPPAIVDALALRDVNVIFTLGGDGTLAGANVIYEEVKRRGLPICVIGIPKTIDNDVLWVSKTFGFETAVQQAVEAIRCAQIEAKGAFHGVGIVKLMGRNCGLLTATAAAAVNGIDFVLVPEVNLVMEGENGFLTKLVRRVIEKGWACVAVAEGAGQKLFETMKDRDPSGNLKLQDIGLFVQASAIEEFKHLNIEASVRYINPSYMLRAQPTTAYDSVFCALLGQNAVHAAMAGKTGIMIGYAHGQFTHVPLKTVSLGKKQLETDGPLWNSVLASTGQPAQWG